MMAIDIGHITVSSFACQVLKACDPASGDPELPNHVVHVLTILLNQHTSRDIQKLSGGLTFDPHPVLRLVHFLLLLLLVCLPRFLEGVFDFLVTEDVGELTQMDNSLLLTH